MATYLLAYTDAGAPSTGLSPTLDIYVKASDGTSAGTPPTVSELSGGLYKFSVAVAELVVVRVDSNDGAMADSDRYIFALLRPDDSDAYVTSIAAAVAARDLSGVTEDLTDQTVGGTLRLIRARFFDKMEVTATEIKLYTEDDTTALATQVRAITSSKDTRNKST